MQLYLVQHGEALSKEIDPDRALSDRGRKDVEHLASFLAGQVRVERVFHSGKTRARQTAEILASAVASGREVEQLGGLAPNDPVEPFVKYAEEQGENLLVVGHLPFMARLAARLVAGSGKRAIFDYRPGSIVCLETGEGQPWRVQWMVRPELLPEAAQ
ncbi:MAG: phosphohistidine phosphatase SixA [Pseudomonadota bacterium]